MIRGKPRLPEIKSAFEQRTQQNNISTHCQSENLYFDTAFQRKAPEYEMRNKANPILHCAERTSPRQRAYSSNTRLAPQINKDLHTGLKETPYNVDEDTYPESFINIQAGYGTQTKNTTYLT